MYYTTEAGDLERHKHSFYPMPNRLLHDGTLRRLWKGEGDPERSHARAAIALLPIIGVYANTTGELWAGYDKMARLAGVSRSSVAAGATALQKLGLVVMRRHIQPNGLPVSAWRLVPGHYVPEDQLAGQSLGEGDGYFSFPASAVYGGNWAHLSPVQKAIYLAVGASVRTQDRTKFLDAFGSLLPPHVLEELRAREGRRFMPAFLSQNELARAIGVSRSAIQTAIRNLRDNRTSLFGAFPTAPGGNTLFVVYDTFDHPMWPQSVENQTPDYDELYEEFVVAHD